MAARRLGPLLAVARFLAPYRWRLAAAAAALLVTAGATLALGRGIQFLIDRGIAGGTSADLGRAVGLILLISTLIAVGTGTYLRMGLDDSAGLNSGTVANTCGGGNVGVG